MYLCWAISPGWRQTPLANASRHGSALPGHLRDAISPPPTRGSWRGRAEAGPLPHRGGGHTGLRAALPVHHSVAGRAGTVGGAPERFLLARCYQNALHKAYLCGSRRVAVPLIFSGDCHMPRAASLPRGWGGDCRFCQRHPSMEVTLVLYRQSIYDMAKRILGWEDAPS